MGIVDDILGVTDDILGLRDELGAVKYPIYILTRTWSGGERGSGEASDSISKLLPTPYLVDLSHSINLREGGSLKQGDLLLKMISRAKFKEEDINCSVSSKNTEKFYFIKNLLYEVVSITEHYVYFNVQIRKATKQKVYL